MQGRSKKEAWTASIGGIIRRNLCSASIMPSVRARLAGVGRQVVDYQVIAKSKSVLLGLCLLGLRLLGLSLLGLSLAARPRLPIRPQA
jgi:hypothetical protein